jgi:PTH1 family peptidyl-tRNA hydrolase
MLLIAGLGNPGPVHRRHRHNVGFMAVDRIVQRHWPMGSWRGRFQAETQEFSAEGQKILAIKPQTFMNMSGNAIGEAAEFYKIAAEDVVVIHDDLDLSLGRLEFKRSGGHGGHNGLKSIDDRIGQNYWRLRIGIGHPADRFPIAAIDREKKQQLVLEHVLGNFHADELLHVEPALDRIAESFPHLAKQDFEGFRKLTKGEPAETKG